MKKKKLNGDMELITSSTSMISSSESGARFGSSSCKSCSSNSKTSAIVMCVCTVVVVVIFTDSTSFDVGQLLCWLANLFVSVVNHDKTPPTASISRRRDSGTEWNPCADYMRVNFRHWKYLRIYICISRCVFTQAQQFFALLCFVPFSVPSAPVVVCLSLPISHFNHTRVRRRLRRWRDPFIKFCTL